MTENDEQKALGDLGKAMTKMAPLDDITRPIEIKNKKPLWSKILDTVVIIVLAFAATLVLLPFLIRHF